MYAMQFATLDRNGCIGDYCSVKSGFAFKSSWWTTAGVKVIKIGSINQDKELLGNYILDTEEHINDIALSKSSAKLLPSHSVLIAMYGATVGAHGIISKSMACNQAVCALLCNKKYPYTYLFQIAQEQQQKLINMAVGSAQQNISQILIKQLPLHSDISSIRKFHDLALPLHKQIEELQAENRALSKMRDTLLPQLMSGKLDVSDIDL